MLLSQPFPSAGVCLDIRMPRQLRIAMKRVTFPRFRIRRSSGQKVPARCNSPE